MKTKSIALLFTLFPEVGSGHPRRGWEQLTRVPTEWKQWANTCLLLSSLCLKCYEVVHGSSHVLIAFADFFPLWMFVTDRVFLSDSVICFESGWMFFRLVCSWKGKLTNFFSLSVPFLSFLISVHSFKLDANKVKDLWRRRAILVSMPVLSVIPIWFFLFVFPYFRYISFLRFPVFHKLQNLLI